MMQRNKLCAKCEESKQNVLQIIRVVANFRSLITLTMAVIKDLVSVQMIASLGGNIKPLALSPSYFLIN